MQVTGHYAKDAASKFSEACAFVVLALLGLLVAGCPSDNAPKAAPVLLEATQSWASRVRAGGDSLVDPASSEWAGLEKMLARNEIPLSPFVVGAAWWRDDSTLSEGSLDVEWVQRTGRRSPVPTVAVRVQGGAKSRFSTYEAPGEDGYSWTFDFPLNIVRVEGVQGVKTTSKFVGPRLELSASRNVLERGLEIQLIDDEGRHSNWIRVRELRRAPEFDWTALQDAAIHVLLDSPNADARAEAAWSLDPKAGGQGPEAVTALTHALADPSSRVQAAACVSLRDFGPQAAGAVSGLATLIGNNEEIVAYASLLALAGIGPRASPALERVQKAMASPDRYVRLDAALAAIAISNSAEPYMSTVLSTLESKNPWAVVETVGILGPLGEDAVPDLVRLLRQGGPGSGQAADAIGAIGRRPKESVDGLLHVLTGTGAEGADGTGRSPAVGRGHVIRALGSFPSERERTIPVLVKLVREGDLDQDAALGALGRLGYPGQELAPTLEDLLQSNEDAERLGAYRFLLASSPTDASAQFLTSAHDTLAQDENAGVRASAVDYAGAVAAQPDNRARALAVLSAACADPYAPIRLSAVRCLANYVQSSPEDTVTALVARLSDLHYEVVRTAAQALTHTHITSRSLRSELKALRAKYPGSQHEEWDKQYGLQPLPELIGEALGEQQTKDRAKGGA